MKLDPVKIFSWFFVIIIASVPVVQSISEYKEKNNIQVFNIFEDTFITPDRNLKSISNSIAEFKNELNKTDSILSIDNAENKTHETLFLHLEEALAISENIKRKHVSVNRYVSDSNGTFIPPVDSLISETSELAHAVFSDPESLKKQLPGLQTRIDQISNKIRKVNIAGYLRQSFLHFFKHTVFNRHYLRKYEDDIKNSSIFANSVRPVVQFINFAFFHNPGDKAILGKSGWMFYRPDVEYLYKPSVTDPRSRIVDYNSQPLQDDPLNTIINFKNQLSKMGIDLLVMIVPGKPSVYPDLIDPCISISGNPNVSHSLNILELLGDNGIQAIDLFTPFLLERQRDSLSGDSLYLRTDTHWKNRGPRLAASITAAMVKQMPWFHDDFPKTEYITDSVEIFRKGDIGTMIKLPEFKIGNLQFDLPLEKTRCYKVFSVIRNDSGEIVSRNLYKDDHKKSRILILGDSFSRIYQTDEPRGAGWISQLAFELSEPLASIINDGGASTIVRQTLAKKATLLKGKKLVIWQFVERDLRFGAEGWKDVVFQEENGEK